jgi:hypothetical protein
MPPLIYLPIRSSIFFPFLDLVLLSPSSSTRRTRCPPPMPHPEHSSLCPCRRRAFAFVTPGAPPAAGEVAAPHGVMILACVGYQPQMRTTHSLIRHGTIWRLCMSCTLDLWCHRVRGGGRGDARNVLCEAVERHHVVSSHGYGEGGHVQCHLKNQCSILPHDFEAGCFRFCLRSVLNVLCSLWQFYSNSSQTTSSFFIADNSQ